MRDKLLFLLKFTFSFGLIVYLIRMVDLSSFLDILIRSNYKLLILAFLIQLFGLVLNSFRIVQVFYILRLKISPILANFLTLVGIFYSLFLPGQISGDIAKAIKIFPLFSQKTDIFMALFVDRVVGFVGLLISLVTIYFAGGQGTPIPKNGILILISIVLLSMFLMLLLFGHHMRSAIIHVNKFGLFPERIYHKLISLKIWEHFDLLRKNYLSLIGVIIFAVFSFYVLYLASFVICLSLDIQISFFYVAWIVSVSAVLIMLPISISGLGVREGAAVYFMTLQGINPEKGLAFSAVGLAMSVIVGLMGGVLNVVSFSKFSKPNLNNLH